MISISEEKLPDFFKDESRRNVLYAPLRSRSVNPNDWNSKITSWSQLITLYSSSNNIYSFSVDSLKEAFRHEGRTPPCINEVVDHMLNNGDLVPLDKCLQKKPTSWKQWTVNTFVTSPLSWSFDKMKKYVSNSERAMVYVPIRVVEQEGDLLVAKMLLNCKNKVISLKEFLEMESKDMNKATDYKILFTNLYNRGKIDILELPEADFNLFNDFLIKFNDGRELSPISEADMGIRKLQQNENLLEKNIEILEDNIMKCIKEAKTHLVKGHRQLAKSFLKKKHEIESRIDQKVKALHNVQNLLHKLQDAKMDKYVWESYKQAVAAFDETYKKGMNEDAVEDTMLKVEEVVETHNDIQSALARPVTDEDVDLEEELEQLLQKDIDSNFNNDDNNTSPQKEADEKLIKELEKLDLALPDVPSPIRNKYEDNASSQLH